MRVYFNRETLPVTTFEQIDACDFFIVDDRLYIKIPECKSPDTPDGLANAYDYGQAIYIHFQGPLKVMPIESISVKLPRSVGEIYNLPDDENE